MGTTSASDDLNGVRALVVEDTWHVGKALRRLLEALGAEVAGPAASVSEAECLIAKCSPTVAFVDVKLRDGELAYSLIDALHQRGIRVIVTTAFAVLPEGVEKIAFILPKPYTAAKVLATLRQLASERTSD
jgi:DNA-binding NtrC family response regulator